MPKTRDLIDPLTPLVRRHVAGSAPQLFPQDEMRCIMCVGGSGLLLLDLRSGSSRRIAPRLKGGEGGAGAGAGGGQGEAASAPPAPKAKGPGSSREAGVCVFDREGRCLYCVLEKKVLRLDSESFSELARWGSPSYHVDLPPPLPMIKRPLPRKRCSGLGTFLTGVPSGSPLDGVPMAWQGGRGGREPDLRAEAGADARREVPLHAHPGQE
jgi:hypothetical protein